MNLPKNIQIFLTALPLKEMSGDDVFVAIAFFITGGSLDMEFTSAQVKSHWLKSVIGKAYNGGFVTRAKGRIHSSSLGKFSLTEEGSTYVERLFGAVPSVGTALVVFRKKQAHLFDKRLREILKGATSRVDIADTYVSSVLFDTLLENIPDQVPIRFAYGKDVGGFLSVAARFSKQYHFESRQTSDFHDRFIIVDDKGYLIGPSLKDAADRKPATLVTLSREDSTQLVELFKDIWNGA